QRESPREAEVRAETDQPHEFRRILNEEDPVAEIDDRPLLIAHRNVERRVDPLRPCAEREIGHPFHPREISSARTPEAEEQVARPAPQIDVVDLDLVVEYEAVEDGAVEIEFERPLRVCEVCPDPKPVLPAEDARYPVRQLRAEQPARLELPVHIEIAEVIEHADEDVLFVERVAVPRPSPVDAEIPAISLSLGRHGGGQDHGARR